MVNEFFKSKALLERYKLEQSEGLNKINRIIAWPILALIAYLTIFSDPRSFPELSGAMLPGRLVAMGIAVIVGIVSFLPQLKKYGFVVSFLVFFGGGFMHSFMAAATNNESSSVLFWIILNVIFCGIYPLPVVYCLSVVIITDVAYLIVFFGNGYAADVTFQQVMVNVNSASFITLLLKIGIERIRKREFFFRTGLQKANTEIATLNERLQDENLRLTHELQIAQHIQSIVLPRKIDYRDFSDLDIACQMIPATEVGGDYYDTITFEKGGIISMGDVTDHGLHSGLIMMMVHTALRALISIEKENIRRIFTVINKLLYDFRLKTEDHRIMSLIILKYLGGGDFVLTGQHESLFIFRKEGGIEDISSLEYGMYAGLDNKVDKYLDVLPFSLNSGDVMVLYTDGVTEAVNDRNEFFGGEGIVEAVKPLLGATAETLKDSIIESCRRHIDNQKIYDDISVMVLRKK
jgi:serine phosphatase RsbU (regulator of sigma subunit)